MTDDPKESAESDGTGPFSEFLEKFIAKHPSWFSEQERREFERRQEARRYRDRKQLSSGD